MKTYDENYHFTVWRVDRYDGTQKSLRRGEVLPPCSIAVVNNKVAQAIELFLAAATLLLL